MKTCVHCAEEIQDEAAICRHCGRAVPNDATSITHRGRRYGLGTTTEDKYGLWNLESGGDPVSMFPKTGEGWALAWSRYQTLDQGGGRPASQVVVQGPTNGKAVASLVLGILWLYGIGSILALIFGILGKNEIDQSGGTQSGRGMAIAGIVLGIVGLALLLIGLIGVATYTSGF